MNNRLFILLLLLVLTEGFIQVVQGEPPASAVVIDVPEYSIEKIGGWDYVDIPGGSTLLVVGKPRIPFYSVSIEYPIGYRIQGVTMRERSGLATAEGLNLSTVTWIPASSPESSSASGDDSGWYPEKDFSWQVLLNLDGSTALVIDVFPFYYNSGTKEVMYYRHYEFDVACVFSSVSILNLATEKPVYDPGEDIVVNVSVNNSGETKDVVASTLISEYGSDEAVAGLPLKMLRDLAGEASFTIIWEGGGFQTGDYCVEVMINDTSGNWLDRRVYSFRIGKILVNVTDFIVDPTHFEVGEPIDIELEARNVGSCSVSGRCVFLILKSGYEVERIHHNFSYLAPGESLRFSSTWNTSSAEEGAVYHVMGYVSYESQTTSSQVAAVSTNLFPLAEFSFTPVKVGLGEVVTFDASASTDPDGALTSYDWSFGDGGNAIGRIVSHAYHELGLYEVSLIVTDNEGATGEVGQFLTVVMSYTLNVSSNVGMAIQGTGTYKEGDEVVLTAPTSTGMPGVLGLLGAKYGFREWVGALNSTEGTVRLVLTGYVPRLAMQAMYVEDYTGAIIVVSIAVIAFAIIVAIYIRKRAGGAAPKGVPPPPPPPSAGQKAESLGG